MNVQPAHRGLATSSKALLVVAVLVHLSLLLSWQFGFWNRFTFDSTTTHGRRGWDFYALYQAGHNVLTGISAYESDNDKIAVVVPWYTPFRYLPISAYTLGVGLNLLSPSVALYVWAITVEIVLLLCCRRSWRLAREPNEAATLASMWLLYTPFYLELYLGQFTLVQAALVFWLLLAADGTAADGTVDRRSLGPAWVLSLLWKQNTALFAPLFVRQRRWRLLAGAATAVALTSLPYFIAFPSSWSAFLANFRAGPPAPQLGNLGVRQFLYSLASWLAPWLDAPAQTRLQTVWVAAVLLVGLVYTLRRKQPDTVLCLCFWAVSYVLLYHHVWEHHYVFLLPVLVLLYHRYRSWWLLLLYGLLAVWTPYRLVDPHGLAAYDAAWRWTPLEPRLLDVWYHASKALPALALWGSILWLDMRPGAAKEKLSCSIG